MNPSIPASNAMHRRDFLQKTLFFSTGLLGTGLTGQAYGEKPDTEFSDPGLNLLAFGDFGSKNDNQKLVADQMARFAKSLNQPLDGVLALGDNFYGKMTPDRFDRHFEKMYDPEALNCPFYACLGNHDYEYASYGIEPEPRKSDLQLKYARENPSSRWKMPAKWYALELPNPEQPLLKIIIMDSNLREGDLTPQEKLEQKRFLKAELAKKTKAPWLWLVWHHPLFTETTHRKDSNSLARWADEALQDQPVSLCISGHDHNLQHLRVEGYSADFIVSGGGGAGTYEVAPSKRGFTQRTLGFNHFHISPTRIKAQFIDADGHCLHAFRRYSDGRTRIIKVAPPPKKPPAPEKKSPAAEKKPKPKSEVKAASDKAS